jgi:hypothetical protein
MKRTAGVVIISLILSGCARLPSRGLNASATDSFRDKLATASAAIAKGKKREAATILKDISAHSSKAGVTDEALFRLALLRLTDEEDSPDRGESRQLLERLEKEFPLSQWTLLSQPLLGLMDDIEELKRQNRRLTNNRELKDIKGLNQSLIRQNRDLQQTLDRLKAMDLELERKVR